MMRYRLTRAAELAEASYDGARAPVVAHQLADSLSEDDVQAHLLTDGTLLIVGSNSWRDYARFNLRIQNLGRRALRLNTVDGVTWHQGFLAHAKVVQDWLMREGHLVSYIIGHSLGAATTQILSAGWGVPGIGFAAPRTCRRASAQEASKRCLLVNRTDDHVCAVPGNFQHLGLVHACRPHSRNTGIDHSMAHYRRIVDEGLAARTLPEVWPPH